MKTTLNKIQSKLESLREEVYAGLPNEVTEFRLTEIEMLVEKAQEIANVKYNLKICTGCGSRSDEKIKPPALACCPDNSYVELNDFLKNSIYKRKV